MNNVLEGMRVVESAAFVAVPLAGMNLAQMGAEVIRIDPIGGAPDYTRWPVTEGGQSMFWAELNKGKRSLAVDMRSERGREIVNEVITAAGQDGGMFMTNRKVPGWLDYETLSARRPDLIMVTLTGDRHGRPQVDYTVNPAVGFPDATGPEGSTEPVAHVLPAWDCIAGNMAVSALLAAERRRLRTGEGQEVTLTLKDVAAAMLGNLGIIGEVAVNGEDRPKGGNSLYGAYGQDFVCADGRRIMVIGLTQRQWRKLVEITGTGEEMASLESRLGLNLKEQGARYKARHEITEILQPWFAARTLPEIAEILEKNTMTWGEFRSFARAVHEDPDISPENPMFANVEQPGIGTYPVPGSPMAFSGSPRRAPTPAPHLGADTEAVLADVAKLPSGEIGKLFDEGVVAGAST